MDVGDEKAGSHIRFLTGPKCVQDFAQVDTSTVLMMMIMVIGMMTGKMQVAV